MFYKASETGFKEILPGIRIKTLLAGKNTLLAEFHMQAGSRLPLHSHPHEQTGRLISGRMRLIVGEEILEAIPGDSWCLPGDVQHRAEILEDTCVIEVFSPVREDYLPYKTD